MANTYNEDYYQALKDENYKTLLKSEIQLDNARQRAMANSNAQLAGSGMASSGYGSTMKTGLENQYLQGLQNAQSNYQNQNTQIGLEQQQAKTNAQNENFNAFSSLMGQATTNDDLNNIVQTYGYGTLGQDGKIIWNQDKLAQLGQENSLQLQSLYGLINSQNTQNAADKQATAFNEMMNNFTATEFKTQDELDEWKKLYADYDNMTDLHKNNTKQFILLLERLPIRLQQSSNQIKISTTAKWCFFILFIFFLTYFIDTL